MSRCLNIDPKKRPTIDSLAGLVFDSKEFLDETYKELGDIKNLPMPFVDHFGTGEIHLDPQYEMEKRIIESDFQNNFKFVGVASRNIGTPRFYRALSKIGNAKFVFPDISDEQLVRKISQRLSKNVDTVINDISIGIEMVKEIQSKQPSVEIKVTGLVIPWRFSIIDDSILLQRFYGGDRGKSTILACKEGRYKNAMLDFFDSLWENASYVK